MSESTATAEQGEDRVRVVRLSVAFDLTAEAVTAAVVGQDAQLLAQLSLTIAEGTPNAAIAALIGSALESAATGLADHAMLGLSAAVHLIRDVAASQLLGVIE